MISEEEVKKLANLARIELTDDEVARFSKDMGSILEYVDSVKNVKGEIGQETGAVKNILREDGNTREAGVYTEDIIKNAPKSQNNYFVVKKIIDR